MGDGAGGGQEGDGEHDGLDGFQPILLTRTVAPGEINTYCREPLKVKKSPSAHGLPGGNASDLRRTVYKRASGPGVRSKVMTRIDEIAEGIYRISTFVPEIAAPAGFTFNQYLIATNE